MTKYIYFHNLRGICMKLWQKIFAISTGCVLTTAAFAEILIEENDDVVRVYIGSNVKDKDNDVKKISKQEEVPSPKKENIRTVVPASKKHATKHVEQEEVIKVTSKPQKKFWHYIDPLVSFRGGLDYAKVGGETKDVSFSVSPPIPNQYVPTEKWQSEGFWGAFIGVELPFYKIIRWQTGLSYYRTNEWDVKGEVLEFSDPAETDLDYTYQVRNDRWMWENKFLGPLNNMVDLYFLAAIGGATNKAKDYKESPIDPTALPNFPFGNKDSNSFTYSFGLGLELAVLEDWRVGIGYQYSDLGEVALAKSRGQVDNSSFEFESTPTHELVGNISYFF